MKGSALQPVTVDFLRGRRRKWLNSQDLEALERSLSSVRCVEPRKTIVLAGDTLDQSTLLVEGYICRYMDDSNGHRQLIAVHVPGDFVDLHGYPLKRLDHNVATLSRVKIANIAHAKIDVLINRHVNLARMMWFSTLLDAAMHRKWIFLLGRFDAARRVSHFLCELNVRLQLVGLSNGRQFALPITQTDLAEICGMTSVHCNRVVAKLRQQNLATFANGKVEIHDPVGVARHCEFDPSYLYTDSECTTA